jgi:hypothetical protein
MEARVGFSGKLGAKVIRAKRAPLSWKLRTWVRYQQLRGWLGYKLAPLFSKLTGIVTMMPRLGIVHIAKSGAKTRYGYVYHLVTTAFVEFMVDQLQTETSEWGDFKYHDSGVGTTAAAVGDTDIETTDGESRATGSQTEGATAEIYKSVGTISYTTTKAITEHGLFSQATGTTLMDRHVFSAINVENGDSIEFTYELTVNDGG